MMLLVDSNIGTFIDSNIGAFPAFSHLVGFVCFVHCVKQWLWSGAPQRMNKVGDEQSVCSQPTIHTSGREAAITKTLLQIKPPGPTNSELSMRAVLNNLELSKVQKTKSRNFAW